MSNYDLRLELPAHAFVTFQLLSLLEQGGTLHEAKKRLFLLEPYRSQNLDPYDMKVFSHSALISVLFCAIVVPREFLALPRDHKLYKEYEAARVLSYFNVREPAAMDSYTFIRCLRNSVAHALFSIKDSGQSSGAFDMQYEFWTEQKPLFRASITHNNLMKFISAVGTSLANTALEQR